MASKKKKEEELTYMQMPLPQGSKASKVTKLDWSGLNKRQTMDTGNLSMESNISTDASPYLIPSQKREFYLSSLPNHSGFSGGQYRSPIGLFGFDDFLLVIYRDTSKIKIDYIDSYKNVYTGIIKSSGAALADEYPRCIVKFNLYDVPTDAVSGEFIKKLLIFPDKVSMDFNISDDFTLSGLDFETNQVPELKYVTVHLSRLFGVNDGTVYASGFNDYSNWNLDTVDEYNESNAWCSPAQSNNKADGNFTGITTFQNHVICFKKDFMHEIYNTKNPFRIQDIFNEGTIDNRTIQEVDGRLIFVSDDNVKIYSGANPRIIGYNLNMSSFRYAVSGSDGRKYYLYCEDEKEQAHFFVYDTYTDRWAEEEIDCRIISFAENKNGIFMMSSDGDVYKLNTGSYEGQVWSFETDMFTGKTIDIKHVKKIQLLADIAENASMSIYILYDDEKFSERNSHKVYSSNGRHGKIPIKMLPRKTANFGFRLHIQGKGYVKIYEMETHIFEGGSLYV